MAESSVAMVVMNPDLGSRLFLFCSTKTGDFRCSYGFSDLKQKLQQSLSFAATAFPLTLNALTGHRAAACQDQCAAGTILHGEVRPVRRVKAWPARWVWFTTLDKR